MMTVESATAKVAEKEFKASHTDTDYPSKEDYCSRCIEMQETIQSSSWLSKLIRIFVIIFATLCTGYVCYLSSERYFNSWVQTVIERTDLHVSEIPFPAVTICPVGFDLYFLKKASQNLIEVDENEVLELAKGMLQISWASEENEDFDNSAGTSQNFDNFSKFNNISLNKFLEMISYKCEDIFESCKWRRSVIPCCELFRRIETYIGICYSFNSIHAQHRDPTWPWKMAGAGPSSGLEIKVKRHNNQIPYLNRIAAMIHDPEEFAPTRIRYLNSDIVYITVNPLRFTADPEIYSVKPELRHCYFKGERMLMGTSKSSCMSKCRLEFIESKCNCTFYLPTPIRDQEENHERKRTPICVASDLKCLYENRIPLFTAGNVIQEFHTNECTLINCGCYPNCDYIEYKATFITDNINDDKHSMEISVHYQHDTIFSYRSSLRFTFLDLLVSYGGIAGLFLGLSLIGIIEAIHKFFTCKKKPEPKREKFSTIRMDAPPTINLDKCAT